jgi:hypothetical protein
MLRFMITFHLVLYNAQRLQVVDIPTTWGPFANPQEELDPIFNMGIKRGSFMLNQIDMSSLPNST